MAHHLGDSEGSPTKDYQEHTSETGPPSFQNAWCFQVLRNGEKKYKAELIFIKQIIEAFFMNWDILALYL